MNLIFKTLTSCLLNFSSIWTFRRSVLARFIYIHSTTGRKTPGYGESTAHPTVFVLGGSSLVGRLPPFVIAEVLWSLQKPWSRRVDDLCYSSLRRKKRRDNRHCYLSLASGTHWEREIAVKTSGTKKTAAASSKCF